MEYRNEEEKVYFASDLNKFVNENCSKEMTAINIDLLLYKRSQKRIRIIESKHSSEKIPDSQKEVLTILSTAAFRGYKYEVYMVMGDPPDYDSVKIIDLNNGKEYKIQCKQDFLDWLEFKKELEEMSHCKEVNRHGAGKAT